jgi:hypothetical protein
MIDGAELPVGRLTNQYGLAALLIGESSQFRFKGAVALIENLELFLNADLVVPDVEIVLNSAGRISDRLIACLARSHFGEHVLLHLPDYDPVGLSDYLRLNSALAGRAILFVPSDLNERFARFGNRDLIAKKPRNRDLLEQLGAAKWPCAASAEVFRLIRETGCGLEQECLLLTKSPDLL